MKRKLALMIAATGLLAACSSNDGSTVTSTATSTAASSVTSAATAEKTQAAAASDQPLEQLIIDHSEFPAGYEDADLPTLLASFGNNDEPMETAPAQCAPLGTTISDMVAWTKLSKEQSVFTGLMKDETIIAVKLDAEPLPDYSGCESFTRTTGSIDLNHTSTTFETGIEGTTGYKVLREGVPTSLIVAGTVGGHGFTVFGEDANKDEVLALAKAQAEKLA